MRKYIVTDLTTNYSEEMSLLTIAMLIDMSEEEFDTLPGLSVGEEWQTENISFKRIA